MSRSTFSVLLTSFGILLSSVQDASAFLVLDNDAGEIVVINRVTARYDSNIGARSDSSSDLIVAYRPTFRFRREAGLIHLDASAGVEAGTYLDNSNFNYLNPLASLSLSFPNGVDRRFYSTLDLAYNESTIADPLVGQILEVDTFTARFSAQYKISDKFGARFIPSYLDRGFDREGTSGLTRTSLRLEGYYDYSERLSLYGGYRFRDIDNAGGFAVSGGADLFFIGAEGSLLTKMIGRLEGGIQNRTFDIGLADESEPYFDLGVSWAYSDRLVLSADITQDFEVTANSFSTNPLSFSLDAEYDWNDKILVNAGLEWIDFDYVGLLDSRSDDYFGVSVGLAYEFTKRSVFDISLTYGDRGSTFDDANFDRLQLLLGYSLIY